MAYRNVIIESPASVSMRSGQLLIRTEGEHTVAIEDLSSLLLESLQSTITTAALSRLGQCGCTVFICDQKHMPCAVLTPFCQHSRSLSVLQAQMSATEPAKKRLWQAVVRAKIRNQARCLSLAGLDNASDHLHSLAARVRSGDTDNVEATAAQFYFPALFGCGFTRADETGINSGLNYGYAILRGFLARSLAVYGFQPAFGIHHRSGLNPYNLADDLIEPYRPVIDLLVFQSIKAEDSLTPPLKQMLFNCLNLDMLSGGQHHSVSYAMERTVQSLGMALTEKGAQLTLPELLPTSQHRYE